MRARVCVTVRVRLCVCDSLCVLRAASDFKQGSSKLRKKMWWKNAKLNACIVLVVVGE